MIKAILLSVGMAFGVFAAPHAVAQPEENAAQLRADDNPFAALVGKRRSRQNARQSRYVIERYVLASDDRAFLFEDRGDQARLQFLCGPSDPRIECHVDPEAPAPEIYILEATRAPRGDVIYKNPQGETYLRIASYGGATVYWPGETLGAGASKSFGDLSPLELGESDAKTVRRRAKNATAMISSMVGAPITFEIETALRVEGAASVLADAVVVAAKGLLRVADDPTGAQVVGARLKRIVFTAVEGAPDLALQQNTLEVRFSVGSGLQGRPSSSAIVRFLEESL